MPTKVGIQIFLMSVLNSYVFADKVTEIRHQRGFARTPKEYSAQRDTGKTMLSQTGFPELFVMVRNV